MIFGTSCRTAVLFRVIAGDDIILLVGSNTEDGIFKKRRVRLEGVDTPNRITHPNCNETISLITTVEEKLTGQLKLDIVYDSKKSIVGKIFYRDEEENFKCLNDELISLGYRYNR